jgi:hypothetical protein
MATALAHRSARVPKRVPWEALPKGANRSALMPERRVPWEALPKGVAQRSAGQREAKRSRRLHEVYNETQVASLVEQREPRASERIHNERCAACASVPQ